MPYCWRNYLLIRDIMEHAEFNTDLLEFLNASPTPWHAVASMKHRLDEAGFKALDEREDWELEAGQGYYAIRNGSSIVAFRTGRRDPAEAGIRMVGAHTDSPCLKVKPNPELRRKGFFQLGVEVYGGVLLNPWFDRDLSLAGRVTYVDESGSVKDTLIDFRKAVAYIPSLAIHLDREANSNRTVNPQTDLPPVLMQVPEDDTTRFTDLLTDATTFLTDRLGDLLGVFIFHDIFEVFGALFEPVDDLTSNLAAFPTHALGDLLGPLALKIGMEPLARARSGGVANFLPLQVYFRFRLPLYRILNALGLRLGWSGSVRGRTTGASGGSHDAHESQTEGQEGTELSHSGSRERVGFGLLGQLNRVGGFHTRFLAGLGVVRQSAAGRAGRFLEKLRSWKGEVSKHVLRISGHPEKAVKV